MNFCLDCGEKVYPDDKNGYWICPRCRAWVSPGIGYFGDWWYDVGRLKSQRKKPRRVPVGALLVMNAEEEP
jgi:hypothetical protein